ncbi:zinc ribbon domain-containing protein [Streptomyces sp. NPDC020298]|uniref:NADase-type glycan-binding domain-containing protein n=1 Tax=unclassified Streptomyces TaxID=2593676 RepID=UPI0033D52693
MTTTQNCAECGTRAEPGQSFCDACGAVLSWTGQAGSRAAGSAATASAGGSGPRSGDGPADDSGGALATRPGTTAARSAGGPAGDSGNGSTSRSGTADGPGTAADGGSREARPTAPPAGRTVPAPAAASAPGPASGTPADAGPGWDAFSRRDGGTGLARAPRDLLGSGTASGESGTAPAASGTAPEPAPAALADGDEGGGSAVGTAAAPDAPDTVPSPIGTRPSAPAPVDETAPTAPVPSAAPAPAPGAPDGLTDRARQLLVPVSDPDPRPAASPSVAPVLPGRPAPQRPQAVRAPGEELGADGGIPCPWCATRNRPDRHYCTRCAMPMAGEGLAPARLPWWRRLWGAGHREAPWAGDRPRLRRAFDRVLSWLGAALVLTLLIVLVVNIPKGVQATRDHFAKRAPAAPDKVAASRSYPGHKPELAFDKLSNTWWGPGVADSGQGQWIEARFDQPTRLLDVIITPGTSTHADQLSKSALPHRVEARVTTADGKTTTRELILDQGAGAQRRAFRVGKVTAVRLTLESAYQPSPSKQVAIAEIEFFGPSNAN